MSHFYVTATGRATNKVTRTGTKRIPTEAHVCGWMSGIRVQARYNPELECDEFHIYATGGTAGASPDIPLMVWRDDDNPPE